jgi:predicted DNA-binding protein YlxM (UPF0122 family)
MKKKFLIGIILPILIFGILIANQVEARGFGWKGFSGFGILNLDDFAQRMEKMFENWANLLQISVDKVKNYWAEGKTLREMMEAENISQEDVEKRIKEKRLQEIKDQLQKLVEKGVITQEQADKRFEFLKNQLENQGGKKFFRKWWGWNPHW